MTDVDVVVVGQDPVALASALGLAQAGITVLVLDAVSDDVALSPVVHDWSVLPGLDRLGVLDAARAAGFVDSAWSLHVLGTGERIDLGLGVLEKATPFPFNLHIEPTALCAVLEERLRQEPLAQIERYSSLAGLTQDQSGVTLTLSSADGPRQIRAAWVVGADGTTSAVRRALGVGFPGFTWDERSVTALIDADLDRIGYTSFMFQVDDQYGAVLQKVGPQRWIHVHPEPLAATHEDIGRRLPDIIGRAVKDAPIRVLDWRSERMHQRSADRYRIGRVVLAGEAAHVANRMIGHSPITSSFDAYRISEALVAVVRDGSDDSVLDAYAADRRRVFLDHASPISSSRKLLVSRFGDQQRLDTELDQYRRAAADPDYLREMLLFNNELAGESPVALAARRQI
ncbi:FAD-dependent monooxygenase [Rhodococcus qingshengii]|jgi:3-(3-hydroxy-phenyl)propionate hydroxylase/6-hydroxy-3-succinoylpyridine 3-monooxygenase|uniref:FAD-dependent oxidoreductase n=1 Tax=Rhodococcus TaxID=1827 RepID=UPI001F1CE54E|nr:MULTISPECIES: FAD-dependent monooxygenase [Rhodococcus]MCE4268441.1 FAD-dependent monooxygenase [Rhodococcus globerulus]MDJ0490705.1 FAD-dependent monooxygenase [Rhodococcus qingshengii]